MEESVRYSVENHTNLEIAGGQTIQYGLMEIRSGFDWGSAENTILWDKMYSAAKTLNPTEVKNKNACSKRF